TAPGGIWADGYDVRMAPAIVDDDPQVSGGGLLARSETSGTTVVTAGTNALNFEWITIRGPLRVVDPNEHEISGSRYIFSNSALVIPTGTALALPITDN